MKKIILFLFMALTIGALPTIAQEVEDVNWENLVEDKNLVTAGPDYGITPYNAIPGNIANMYEDVNKNEWAYGALEELTKKYGILEGMPNGKFEGKRAATRFEMAQALASLLNKMEEKHEEMSGIEKAAIASLKKEFEKEIMTLAARVEVNANEIKEVKKTHSADIDVLSDKIENLDKRHFFVPELRLQGGLGDPDPYAIARLRLTSKTYLTKRTFALLRLEAATVNMVNFSERNGDIADADFTLGFVETGDLTSWIPEKLGRLNLIGGLLHTNRIFFRGYRTAVDQRGFTDVNPAVSLFNTQSLSFMREGANGRGMAVGGEYIKKFSKYNGIIKAGGMRGTGGSLDIPGGADVPGSGDENSFYCAMAQMDVPVGKQPVELKVSHFYSFGDNRSNLNTWSVGGRAATKFNNVGVFKAGYIQYGGEVPPRYLGGIGGKGFSVQFAFNPAFKGLGNIFGNPDDITHCVYDYTPGKTEVGVAFANLHNDWDESLRVIDVFVSRYMSKNIWGVVRFTHANPNTRARGLSARNAVELSTVFKL